MAKRCQGLKGQELQICRNKQKTDVRQDIEKLDRNIKNVVSRADGTLEIYVKKQSETTKYKVLNFIDARNLMWSFTKIDFHEVG